MPTQLERAKYELQKAGYTLIPVPENKEWDIEDYTQQIGTMAYEIVKQFCNQGHSGMSAQYCISIITKLLNGDVLTPLTNNPEEWEQDFNGNGHWQSKRKFSCFSDDNLKTYYDINEDCNRNWELDNEGKRTGWSAFVGHDKAVKHPLISEEELKAQREAKQKQEAGE